MEVALYRQLRFASKSVRLLSARIDLSDRAEVYGRWLGSVNNSNASLNGNIDPAITDSNEMQFLCYHIAMSMQRKPKRPSAGTL
jgi:hypothetical protein